MDHPSQWVAVCTNCGHTDLTGIRASAPAARLTLRKTPESVGPVVELTPEVGAPAALVSPRTVSQRLAYAAGVVGIACMLVIVGATLYAHNPVALDATILPACVTEDSTTPCYWDAAVHGNGTGRSFTVLQSGEVRYW